MEFIEYTIPVLEIEIVLRKKLLSLSALKSCFCMYGSEFLDIPYSVIGFSCILHTADTKPFKVGNFNAFRIIVRNIYLTHSNSSLGDYSFLAPQGYYLLFEEIQYFPE